MPKLPAMTPSIFSRARVSSDAAIVPTVPAAVRFPAVFEVLRSAFTF
jgi:hypothetical protein